MDWIPRWVNAIPNVLSDINYLPCTSHSLLQTNIEVLTGRKSISLVGRVSRRSQSSLCWQLVVLLGLGWRVGEGSCHLGAGIGSGILFLAQSSGYFDPRKGGVCLSWSPSSSFLQLLCKATLHTYLVYTCSCGSRVDRQTLDPYLRRSK